MSFDKRRMAMKVFIELFPFNMVFHLKTLNNKINQLYERALRIVYSD